MGKSDDENENWKINFEEVTSKKLKIATLQGCQKFLSSRLIMNSRRLWNSHERRKFLRAKASMDILKFGVSEMTFTGGFHEVFSAADTMLFRENTRKTGNNGVEMQAFNDIARLECFTDLNLFTGKYVFNVIKTGKQLLYNFIWWCLFFVSSYSRRR